MALNYISSDEVYIASVPQFPPLQSGQNVYIDVPVFESIVRENVCNTFSSVYLSINIHFFKRLFGALKILQLLFAYGSPAISADENCDKELKHRTLSHCLNT